MSGELIVKRFILELEMGLFKSSEINENLFSFNFLVFSNEDVCKMEYLLGKLYYIKDKYYRNSEFNFNDINTFNIICIIPKYKIYMNYKIKKDPFDSNLWVKYFKDRFIRGYIKDSDLNRLPDYIYSTFI